MCECQGNPLARVDITLALGLPYLLVNRALESLLSQSVALPKALLVLFWSEVFFALIHILIHIMNFVITLSTEVAVGPRGDKGEWICRLL